MSEILKPEEEKIRQLAEKGFPRRMIEAMLHLDEWTSEMNRAYEDGVSLFSHSVPSDMDDQEEKEEKEQESDISMQDKTERGYIKHTKLSLKYEYRKAFSEVSLLECLGTNGFHFEKDMCYCFISGGDVDSLSFLKAVLMQQNIEHLLISTWCMAIQDILELRGWIDQGKITSMDMYVGEIFKGTYAFAYAALKELYEQRPQLGRMAIFRNHSKVMAGKGDRFSFSILSSANVNTNPRCEQTCIIVNESSYEFFKNFYDGIKSFE